MKARTRVPFARPYEPRIRKFRAVSMIRATSSSVNGSVGGASTFGGLSGAAGPFHDPSRVLAETEEREESLELLERRCRRPGPTCSELDDGADVELLQISEAFRL